MDDDDGWVWLPHDEVMELQRRKNAHVARMLDQIEPPGPRLVDDGGERE